MIAGPATNQKVVGSNPAGLTREAVVETASFFVPLAQIMHITVSFEAVLCISHAILSGYARMSLSSLKPSKDAFALILSPFYGAKRFSQPRDYHASGTHHPQVHTPPPCTLQTGATLRHSCSGNQYNTNENACDSYEASIPIERILLLSAQNTSVCITLA